MIDWYNVFANFLWILALSLALATLSFARWEAQVRGQKLKDELNRDRWQLPLNFAGVLFCAGLAATTTVMWERILWLIMLVLFLVQVGAIVITRRKSK
jgi:hypothetical protein